MTTALLTAAAVTFALALTVWLGPRALSWILIRYTNRLNKELEEFNHRRQERNAEIRGALEQLQRYADTRNDSEGNTQ